MSLPELVKKKKEEQHRVEQDAHKVAAAGPPHHRESLGQRCQSDYSRAAHQDVFSHSQVVPQSTCALAGQGVAVKENQSESRTEGFDRISSNSLYLFVTEKCPFEGDPTHVARLCGQALPEATQEAAPKGQEAAEEVLQEARAVGHEGVARDASSAHALCPCYYQGLSALYRPDLCATTEESAANGHF